MNNNANNIPALYPLEFAPIDKETIWGGSYLASNLLKNFDKSKTIGESWELSDIDGNESIVASGELKGKSIREIIASYGYNNIVGKAIDESVIFPLLIKYIEANDKLSIQVHPDDEYAAKNCGGYGKTEMWVILDTTKENAKILVGIDENVSKGDLQKAIENKENIADMFNYVDIKVGDALYIPAGRVHAILDGAIIAEIQQSSDTTFRLYDWDRVDANGNGRDLHIKESFDVIQEKDSEPVLLPSDYQDVEGYKCCNFIKNKYFDTSSVLLENGSIYKQFTGDSFEIIMIMSGSVVVENGEYKKEFKRGNTILLPAALKDTMIKNATSEEAIFLSIRR